jgi:glycolate oxidase iron-sulfur subunit
MRTRIPDALQDDPDIAVMDDILRKCVHCGFCLSACPTYQLSGDERASPRGRIYLIKSMIEGDADAAASIVAPIDSCLSCLACASACPSGVDYQHFIDLARPRIERVVERPAGDRFVRALIARVLPHPKRFRAALALARAVRPMAPLVERMFGSRLAAMLRMAPARPREGEILEGPRTFPPAERPAGRVALLAGCAQQALRPSINDATIRLLNRMRIEVTVAEGVGCCGALSHHMGRESEARGFARAAVEGWRKLWASAPLDAIVINAAGCGTHVKDYAFVLREEALVDDADTIATLADDVSEFIADRGLPPPVTLHLPRVAYHDACSLLHGQRVTQPPRFLLRRAGFDVVEVPGQHFCCGSAGSYNLLQAETAAELNRRRVAQIEATGAEVIATGNIGCLEQLQRATRIPIVHTVELLDWATGGPIPDALMGWNKPA